MAEGFVATLARLSTSTPDTANFQQMSRSGHVATENLTSIKLAFQNFFPGNPDFGLGHVATQTASIEYPSGTIMSQVLFSGSASGVIPDNGVLFSDYTTVSIPSGATFWVRGYFTNPNGVYPGPQTPSMGDEYAVAATGLSDQTMIGSAISGGTSQGSLKPPIAIIGHTINPSVLIIGDSRTAGQGDGGSDANGAVGNIMRSVSASGIPFVSIAVSSEQANTWATTATARNALLPYGSQVIVALGINDLDTGGFTAAQTVAAMQRLLSSAAAPQKYCITIEPHTSSTDSWATVANQTNLSANRVAYNTLVRAGFAGLSGFYEVADVLESGRNSTFWVCAPSPPYTADGLHGSIAAYAAIVSSGVIKPITFTNLGVSGSGLRGRSMF